MIFLSVLVLCVISTVTKLTVALPNEVPYSACEDMKAKGPGHRYAIPQNSKAPYEYKFQHKSIKNTESLEFTIHQKDGGKPFKAFMIQARDDSSETPSKPIGTFWPKDDNARTVTCTNSYAS